MNEHKYTLEKYTGRNSRHHCPACSKPQTFARYIDLETNQYIDDNIGRCNREDNCGYHYTPKEFFNDNPDRKPDFSDTVKKSVLQHGKKEEVKEAKPKKAGYIPKNYLVQSIGYKSNFVAFLCSIFDRYTLESPTIERLMSDYYIGCTKNESIIYWQIDVNNKVRTGKIMQYDRITGKRIKNASGAIDWVHNKLKHDKVLPENFNLSQCLFGEHLLTKYTDKVVALVEGEKSALIAAGVYSDYIWLATGGRSQLSIDRLKVLRGRTIVMFPDTDTTGSTFALWSEKAKELESMGCNVTVSDLLEHEGTDEDKKNGIDIADFLIRQLMADIPAVPLSNEENILQQLDSLNPDVCTLINAFDLVSVTTGKALRKSIN